jgi:hypothetical protein
MMLSIDAAVKNGERLTSSEPTINNIKNARYGLYLLFNFVIIDVISLGSLTCVYL